MSQELPTNSTLDVKLDYITRDLKEIKGDVKEIKADYVSRREFDNRLKEQDDKLTSLLTAKVDAINERISVPLKVMYATIATVLTAALYAILKLIHL